MPTPDRRAALKRYGAPTAFLAAATIAVLLVRAGLSGGGGGGTSGPRTAPLTTAVTTSTAPTTSTEARKPKRRYYTLRAGDTFETVATRFHTTVHQLQLFNPGVKATSLRIGQRLRVG